MTEVQAECTVCFGHGTITRSGNQSSDCEYCSGRGWVWLDPAEYTPDEWTLWSPR